MRLVLRFVAMLMSALVAGLALAAHAQPAPEAPGPMAWIAITLEPGERTKLELTGRPDSTTLARVEAALAQLAGAPPTKDEWAEGWTHLSVELPPLARDGWIAGQTLALDPVLAPLGAAGQRNATVMVTHPVAGFVTLEGATVFSREPRRLQATLVTPPGASLQIALGWRREQIARMVALLALLLVLPVAIAVAIRARSAARDREGTAWFGRAMALNTLAMAGWLAWMFALEATRAPELVRFALGGRGAAATLVPGLLWLAPLPGTLVLVAIGRGIMRRVRGLTPGLGEDETPLVRQVRTFLPLVLVFAGVALLSTGEVRPGVLALAAAFIAGILLAGGRGPLGTRQQALSSGALRDRLFELAGRAGVRLRELSVVPMRRERLANAFAVNGGAVIVGDALLDHLSRREVDAILAHEITHLEHHHPLRIMLAAAGAATVVATLSAFGMPFGLPLGFAIGWLTWLAVSRRCEFAADAGAAALTGDAAAMISALGRLQRANDLPLAWGRWSGALLTHPTTEARALALARRAGLAPEPMRALLEHGLDDDARYHHDARATERERVFSTHWKLTVARRLSLALLGITVVAPAALVAAARASALELPHAAAILGGAALGALAMVLAHDRLAARGIRALEPAIRSALPDAGAGAVFVALAPGDRTRIYEGFLEWDLGLLEIEGDRLRYRGEQLALELPRRAVRAIELGAAAPGWIPAPRVVVRWITPDGGEDALQVRDAATGRVGAIAAASRALAARLRAWHESGASAGALHHDAAPPAIGAVTSSAPAEAAGLRELPAIVIVIGVMATAAGMALGLDLAHSLDVFAAAVLGLVIVRAPMMFAREKLAPPSEAARPAPERRAA